METGKRDLKLVTVNFSHATVVTKEFISKTSLKACFCHAGLSGIFLQEGFPTSGHDIQVALLMTVLVTRIFVSTTYKERMLQS